LSKRKYIELLKKSLIDFHNIKSVETYSINVVPQTWKIKILKPINLLLSSRNFGIYKLINTSKEKRLIGEDWPSQAKTMIGLKRLNNVEFCVNAVLENNVKGDLVETGIWRGGVIIFMKALLELNNIEDRKVWGFDSFEGLPKPNTKEYPQDTGHKLHDIKLLSSSKEEVLKNFKLYEVDTKNVLLEKGWFKDTLPNNKIGQISVLRLDGDLFESTWLALKYLYPKVSEMGYIIIDDYHAFESCKKAVDKYIEMNNINASLKEIDNESVYWKKISI